MTPLHVPLGEAGVAVLDCEHRTPPALEAGYPYVAIPDIQDGRVDLASARRISRTDLDSWTRRSKPKAGDIVVTRRGRVGDTAPIPDGVECAIGQNLVLLRSDGRQVDQRYLRWATRGPAWRSEVERLTNVGAVFSSLNVREIPQLKIPVFPLAVQQAIAEVLGALDDKIAVNERVIRLADGLAESLLLRQVSDGTVKLAEIAEVTMGSSPPGSSYNERGQGVPFYQGVRDFGTRFPSRRVWTDQPVRMASVKDTLLSVRAPVGRSNLASEEMCIGRGLAALRSRTAHPMTLFHQVRAAHSAWAPYEAEGTVFGAISRPQLEGIDVPAVDDLVAADLEVRLAELEGVVATSLRESAILAATRDELLPLLMSGKARVKDAEKTVEGVL